MKILFTSDWQAEVSILAKCTRATEEILNLQQEYGFTLLVHCGDFKAAYNPVDLRVIHFARRAISRFNKAELDVSILLGNHDRLSLHTDKDNWLPILAEAGARVYIKPQRDQPSGLVFTDTFLHFLPFIPNTDEWRQASKALAKEVQSSETTLLVFHGDIQNATYNMLMSASESAFTMEDLHPHVYRYCVGGHIHLQQKIGKNVWYVGSPFACDWGEANQPKGYLLYDTDVKKLYRIRSGIPGMYDLSWPGFDTSHPTSWAGAKVRIQVPCGSTENILETLKTARLEAEALYPGAEIVPIPRPSQEEPSKVLLQIQDPDSEKVASYLDQTCPSELKGHEEALKEKLLEFLEAAGGIVRAKSALRFVSAKTKNCLSFEDLDITYYRGLTVVSGVNEDKGGSNGCGKTNYLQPPAVALFNLTFKGQKNDGWSRRNSDPAEESYVDVYFKGEDGTTYRIYRGRRPRKIQFYVNDMDVSSGHRKEQIQEEINNRLGFTWSTFAATVFVDQQRTNVMLTGTDMERRAFLSQIQNLDRFDRALKIAKDAFIIVEQSYSRTQGEKASAEESLAGLREMRDTIKGQVLITREAVEEQLTLVDQAIEALKQGPDVEQEYSRAIVAERIVRNAEVALERTLGTIQGQQTQLKALVAKFSNFPDTCPSCKQSVTEECLAVHISEIEEEIKGAKAQQTNVDVKLVVAKQQTKSAQATVLTASESRSRYINALATFKQQKIRWKTELQSIANHEQLLNNTRQRIREVKVRIQGLQEYLEKLEQELAYLHYCKDVFARTGLPSFLNAHLCPILNKAAAFYSDLFSAQTIQVQFKTTDEGEFDVNVLNAHGGESIVDQSQGEMRIASLITSFALRHVAPKVGLLVLDEPGEGLDAYSVKMFARGLKQLVTKYQKFFGTILLTSHNPVLLAELAEEHSVQVVKKDGVSRVV